MKKSLLLFLLLPVSAAACFAQESRQDISASASGTYSPFVFANGVQQTATLGTGGLVSYRYMLTPSSAVEGNYQYLQNTNKYLLPSNNIRIHARMQEISGAYVRSFTFKNWNPFVEGGPAAFIFSPIDDTKTQVSPAGRSTQIGFLYGAGIAYEISPSFDIRAEYRGLVMKAPSFKVTQPPINTGRWYDVTDPVIGIAYHF